MYLQGEVTAPSAVNIGSFEGVAALFALASKHLKRPKIRLQLKGAPIVLSVAGSASKAPGSINITDGRRFGENQWFGRISRDGAWTQSNTQADGLTDLLKRLASEPAKVAAEYGRLTCQCCFCGRALEDERSTAVGYGPVCADNFGLPWGAVKTDLPELFQRAA